ncbi:MAG TPA: cyclic nucleotide-binding and patatin-like phospholipase domain-containing protein [Herpetosiphonaceae bacterium]|nr:cyclic nucleotide-binding and patatin-like phospholipase domain-containing protein [Herpetosiphonaceae bacterium]
MDRIAGQLSLTTIVFRTISMGLFDVFDAATLSDLEGELQSVQLGREEALFRQGEPGDSMYVLVRGRLRITVEGPDGTEQIIDELEPGVTVGEMALLTGQPRVATVSAVEEAELVRLSRAAFDRLTTKNPAAMKRFAEAIMPRLQRTQLAGVLTGLFGSLTKQALHELQARLEWRHLASGEALFRPGDPGDSLYIVVNGRFTRVAEHMDGHKHVMVEVSRGEIVGEIELLTGGVHAATVMAVRDSDVVRLTKPSFEHLLKQYPDVMLRIARIMAEDLQSLLGSTPRQGSTVVAFAAIPTSQDVPLRAFAQRLVDELVLSGPALYLNSERIDSLVGKEGIAQMPEDHPANITLAAWLSRQETVYRYIVYEADPVWSEWTRRCVRQADRILLVGCAELDPAPGAIETEIKQMRVAGHQELVLLQPPSRPNPTGTGRWLQVRFVEAHHHVRLHLAADMAHLARMLTGRSLGLVLGGGGARGYAHIGVIRALEEAGLHADLVGGTSMGALIAAYYARGVGPDVIVAMSRQYGSPRRLFDYTLPLLSFFAGKKLSNMLHAVCGDVHIEDLWRPFFCVSSLVITHIC